MKDIDMNSTPQNLADLTGRILLAIMFLLAGLQKIGGYAGTQGYMEAMGVPGVLLPLVIALEVGGAVAIIAGGFLLLVARGAGGWSLDARRQSLTEPEARRA
jgi:putative oxidoreductase